MSFIGQENFITPTSSAYRALSTDEENKRRSVLNRVFDAISVSSVPDALYNLTDGNNETGFFEGLTQDLVNTPFSNKTEDMHSMSEVFGNMGWQPEGTGGKLLRGTVGFVGDVLTDPLTYVTGGFSAGGKILKGTGTLVKGTDDVIRAASKLDAESVAKATFAKEKASEKVFGVSDTIKNTMKFKADGANFQKVKALTIEDARQVIKNKYEAFGREVEDSVIDAEADKLMKGFNKKALHIASDGWDIEVGLNAIPFSSKVKIGDRTMDSFKKTLVTSDKLRKLGDGTIAPYYNKLTNGIRGTSVAKKFNKYANIEELAKTNPVEAAAAYHAMEIAKRMDSSVIAKNVNAMKEGDEIQEYLDSLDKTQIQYISKAIQNGTLDEVVSYMTKKNEFFNNVRSSKKSATDEIKLADEKKLNELKERMKEYVEQYAKQNEANYNSFGQRTVKFSDLTNPNSKIAKRYDTVDLSKFDLEPVTINKDTMVDEGVYTADDYENDLYAGINSNLDTQTLVKKLNKLGTETNIRPDQKIAFVDELNTKLFNGKQIISKTISDDYLLNVIDAFKSGDKTRISNQLRHVVALETHDPTFFRYVNEETSKSFHNRNIGNHIFDDGRTIDNYVGVFDPYKPKLGNEFQKFEFSEVPSLLRELKNPNSSIDKLKATSALSRISTSLGLDSIDDLANINPEFFIEYDEMFKSNRRKYYDEMQKVNYSEMYGKKNKQVTGVKETLGKNKLDETYDRRKAEKEAGQEKQIFDYLTDDERQLYLEEQREILEPNAQRIFDTFEKPYTQLNTNEIQKFQSVINKEQDLLFGLKGEFSVLNKDNPYEMLMNYAKNSKENGGLGLDLSELENKKIVDNDTINNLSSKLLDLQTKNDNLRVEYLGYEEKLKQLEDVMSKIPVEKMQEYMQTGKKNNVIKMYDDVQIKMKQIESNISTLSDIMTETKNKINIKTVKEKLAAQGIGPTTKRTDNYLSDAERQFKNLNVDTQNVILSEFNRYMKNRTISYYSKLPIEEIESQLVDIERHRIDKEISGITAYDAKDAKAELLNKELNIRKQKEQMEELSKNLKDDTLPKQKFVTASKIETLRKEIEEFEKHINSYDYNSAEQILNDVKQFDENDEFLSQLGITLEQQQRIEKLADNDKLMEFYKTFNNRMNELAETEIKAGRLSEEQYQALKGKYVPHILTEEGKKYWSSIASKDGKFNPDIVGIQHSFDKSRSFKTIEEANEYYNSANIVKKMFETNLAEIYVARTIGSNKLICGDETIKWIKKNFATTYQGERELGRDTCIMYEDLDRILKIKSKGEVNIYNNLIKEIGLDPIMTSANNPIIKLTDEQIKTIASMSNVGVTFHNFKPYIYDIVNQASATQIKLLQKDWVNTFDKYQTIWKMWNSVVTPGFHIQNTLSNAYQSFLATGASAMNPKGLKKAAQIIKGADPKQTITINGEKFTHQQLKYMAEQEGLLNTFFGNEFEVYGGEQSKLTKGRINSKIDPTSLNDFIGYKIGGKIGSGIEETQRMNLWLNYLEKGQTPKEAVESVNKFMFDYADLTEFEKTYMKRIIPFYTFMRKNIPMELEQIIEQPQKYQQTAYAINEFQHMSGDNYIPLEDRDEWRQDFIQFPNQENGVDAGININLPYQQLERLAPNKLLGQTSPAIKTPIEALTGKYLYTGLDIESPLDYLAGQNAYTNMLNRVNDKDGINKNLYLEGQLLGLPIGTIYDQSKFNNNR